MARFAPNFRGHSDTEVMLESFATWGVERGVQKLIGMFAFALWETRANASVARPRPARHQAALLGADAVRPSCSAPSSRRCALIRRSRPRSIATRRRCFFATTTSQSANRLSPASTSCHPGICSASSPVSGRASRPTGRLREVARAGRAGALQGRRARSLEELETLLADAVRRRMIADVPLGAFLSGGIDSSTIVALMQAQSAPPGQDLLDRLPRGGLRRGRSRQGRRQASRHRPHRALCDAPRRPWPSSRASPTSTTSRLPIPRRSRPISSRHWREST